MAVELILGDSGAIATNSSRLDGDKQTCVITLEGPYSVIDVLTEQSVQSHVPAGYTIDQIRREGDGQGFGRLLIDCTNYGDVNINAPDFITFKISMEAVQLDLVHHPIFDAAARIEIFKWRNTPLARRFKANGTAQWVDDAGMGHEINAAGLAMKYITAYMKGIESYNIYCPVIDKISQWKRLPGATMSKKSTTGGTVSQFSATLGKWNTPGITLSGFAANGFFQSGDNWAQGNNRVWTRSEQWTWTPDGSTSDVGWIYA